MKRYKIVTFKNDPVKRNLPNVLEAKRIAGALTADFKLQKGFLVKTDWLYTVLSLLRVLYAPIYFVGVLLLLLARLLLALAYFLMLSCGAAKNVIKFIFVWRR